MSSRIISVSAFIAAAALVPNLVFAQSISRVLGYLDIFVGLFLTVSLIMFVGAFIVYLIRYGTAIREEVFPYMYWAITILFVLSVLLGLVHFFQRRPSVLMYIISAIVFVLVVVFIIYTFSKKEGKAEKK